MNMVTYPAPVAPDGRPRHYKLIVTGRVFFWLGLVVLVMCVLMVVMLHGTMSGGLSSIGFDAAFALSVITLITVPLVLSGVAQASLLIGACAGCALGYTDKSRPVLRLVYFCLAPVFLCAAIFFYQLASNS